MSIQEMYGERLKRARTRPAELEMLATEVRSRLDRDLPEVAAFVAEIDALRGNPDDEEIDHEQAVGHLSFPELAALDRQLRARADRDTPRIRRLRERVQDEATPMVYRTLSRLGQTFGDAGFQQMQQQIVAANGHPAGEADVCDFYDHPVFRQAYASVVRDDQKARTDATSDLERGYLGAMPHARSLEDLKVLLGHIGTDPLLDDAARSRLRAAADRHSVIFAMGFAARGEAEATESSTLGMMQAIVSTMNDIETAIIVNEQMPLDERPADFDEKVGAMRAELERLQGEINKESLGRIEELVRAGIITGRFAALSQRFPETGARATKIWADYLERKAESEREYQKAMQEMDDAGKLTPPAVPTPKPLPPRRI